MPRDEFIRLHGCGNSFIVTADDRPQEFDWAAASKKILDPHFGLGSDGLMVLAPSSAADFEVLMFNPDGSRMGMCGNGIRCVTRFAHLTERAPRGRPEIRFLVEGREISCLAIDGGRLVRVDMGTPSFRPQDLPIASETEWVDRDFSVDLPGAALFASKATCLSMGNPHCVMFVADAAAVDLDRIGPAIEHAALFPRRVNAEFVQILAPDRLRVRVWERGAGATLACGTGACASMVAAVRTGRAARRAHVELPGGELDIDWSGERVLMTGPTAEVCRGELSVEFFTPAVKN